MGGNFCRFLVQFGFLWTSVLPSTALGFPMPVDFDGSLMRWYVAATSPPITYGIEAENPDDIGLYQGMIDEAAALWSQVPNSYFAYTPAAAGEAPQVTVQIQSALAGTRDSAGYSIFDEYNGTHPIHCQIVVQSDESVGYTAMAKTFLHELGHCLGLGHSLIPEAIMSYSLDKNDFALDLDDQAGTARLYPAGGGSPKLPPGCAVASGQRGPNDLLPIILLLPMAFTFPLRKRRAPNVMPRREAAPCT